MGCELLILLFLGNTGFVGVIAPARAKDIAPDIQAIVETIHVRAGDRVRAGERIATLDARSLTESATTLTAELKSAEAARRQTHVELEEAEKKLALEKKLAAQDLVTRQTLEDATFAAAKFRAAAARADSVVEEVTAELERARRRVQETIVRAPFDGTIAARLANEGVMVGPESPIVRLIERDHLWVKFAVPPLEAAKLAPGTAVIAELETTGQKYRAAIKHIAPELDPASQMIFIEAELTIPPQQTIPTGVAARVHLSAQPQPPGGPTRN